MDSAIAGNRGGRRECKGNGQQSGGGTGRCEQNAHGGQRQHCGQKSDNKRAEHAGIPR